MLDLLLCGKELWLAILACVAQLSTRGVSLVSLDSRDPMVEADETSEECNGEERVQVLMDFQDWRRQSSTSSCDFHPQHVERPAVGSPTKVSLAALEGQGNPHVPGFSVSASQFHRTDQEAQRDEAGESQPLTTGVDNDLLKLRINEGKISEEIANQVYPGVWATDVPGKAKNATPVEVKLKEGRQPVRIKQYPLRKEDREGIRPVIEKFLQLGLLRECESDFNTPILPVRKPDGSYRVVQDLRAINKITEDLYPVVANPYTLLTVLTPELTWFTVLDLKDAFFCLPLHKSSQKIFAFEWENPKRGRKTQLTWTVLPQGFKNSPTIFGNQLAKDLESWEAPPEEGKLLQYVDDILIATKTEDACMTWTVSLLNFLGLQGYRVSKKKAQVMQRKQGIALGILAQDLGPYRRAVAYFSKQLDATAKGWPGCLRAVAAVVLNIQEARKFTLGQKMTVLVSHTVSVVLEAKGGHWLSPQRFLKYQAIMVEQDDVEIIVTNIVNPASFLSGNTGEPVHHDCLETIETTYSSRSDLRDSPMENTENWFTDGSSYVLSGKRHAGYAITTSQEIIE
ncbi:hypothetical protein GRJ2_002848900 [Grus japonensis]|uniref:ribonuclease H n=1 Tax=Grus japonensis TaxID=30415 RepID=A0ABC9Y1M0_GRUJA